MSSDYSSVEDSKDQPCVCMCMYGRVEMFN